MNEKTRNFIKFKTFYEQKEYDNTEPESFI